MLTCFVGTASSIRPRFANPPLQRFVGDLVVAVLRRSAD
jgi:hypothetical protein